MGNIVIAEANALLTASVTGAAYPTTTTPINLALMTTNGDATTAGTEVTGGSYARVSTSGTFWGTAASGSITNSVGSVSFTSMPSCTIVGIELWDSHSGTPLRRWFGQLTGGVTKVVNLGDTVTFASSSITISLT